MQYLTSLQTTSRVRPSVPKKVLGEPRFILVQLIREPEVAFRVIVKLLTRIFTSPDVLSDPQKRGEGRRSYTGFLRFEEWCVSEKCLALEDAWESCNSLNSILHDFFRGLCLPECYYVELSGYCGCFDEAWDVAELLYDVLAGVVLTCQYGDAEVRVPPDGLARLHTVEAGVSVGRTNVADLADFFDCLVDVLWSVRFQAQD